LSGRTFGPVTKPSADIDMYNTLEPMDVLHASGLCQPTAPLGGRYAIARELCRERGLVAASYRPEDDGDEQVARRSSHRAQADE
jgi:hypothetical protein